MDADSCGHGPRCVICGRFFTPHPRLGERQKCCGSRECRQEYKNRWQRAKYARDGTSRRAAKARVRLWRWNRRGGGRCRRPESGAGPPVAAGDLGRVRDSVALLEQTLAGLVSQTMGCGNRDDLQPLLAQCAERGRQVLGLEVPG